MSRLCLILISHFLSVIQNLNVFEEHAQTETLLHAQHVHKAQLT
jgi:hypothetical protein